MVGAYGKARAENEALQQSGFRLQAGALFARQQTQFFDSFVRFCFCRRRNDGILAMRKKQNLRNKHAFSYSFGSRTAHTCSFSVYLAALALQKGQASF